LSFPARFRVPATC